MKRFSRSSWTVVFALSLVLISLTVRAWAQPWKFGIISDTQWVPETLKDQAVYPNADLLNPNTVAVSIIKQVDRQFIDARVKFVVAVGDLGDNIDPVKMDTRAAFAQELYNNGIGFFPLRGNHDFSSDQGKEFLRVFPQTRTGKMNATPAGLLANPGVVGAHYGPRVNTAKPFTVGAGFSSPGVISRTTPKGTFTGPMAGLSYAFTYKNARFVLLDQFAPANTNESASPSTGLQQKWIAGALAVKPSGGHALVFAHKGIITANHADTLFGADPSKDPDARNAFQKSLQDNGARYFINGHDHMYNRARVASPDGKSFVQDITTPSDSSKLYIPPAGKGNDLTFDNPPQETPIAQELRTIGYTIFTIDGPKVTVEVFTSDNAPLRNAKATVDVFAGNTPVLNFRKIDRFGYSLNGREFLITAGSSYTSIKDGFRKTTASILDGINSNNKTDFNGRAFTKAVNTGWAPAEGHLASDVLTLWGMADLKSESTDTYTLAMSYDRKKVRPANPGNGSFGLAAKDKTGKWVNAVDLNKGGTGQFVAGPWKPGYALGAYGVDPNSGTAWAVINYCGDFAVAGNVAPVPGQR